MALNLLCKYRTLADCRARIAGLEVEVAKNAETWWPQCDCILVDKKLCGLEYLFRGIDTYLFFISFFYRGKVGPTQVKVTRAYVDHILVFASALVRYWLRSSGWKGTRCLPSAGTVH